MGAYKDANGYTRAGKVFRDIGSFLGISSSSSTKSNTSIWSTIGITGAGASLGNTPSSSSSSSGTGFFSKVGNFFKNLFSGSSTGSGTSTSSTSNNTNSGATPPINGNNSSKLNLGSILVTIGTAIGGLFGANLPSSDSTTTDPNTNTSTNTTNNNDASAKSIGTWFIAGIVALIAGILIYVLYRKKAK